MESEAPSENSEQLAPRIAINPEEFLSNIATQESDANIVMEIFFKCNAKKLAEIENLELYEKFFMDIFDTLDKKPLIGKQFLKFFLKNHCPFRTNMFYLICHLMLCSISRFQAEAVHLFAGTLIKLWNSLRPLENEGWLRKVVKILPTKIIRTRIYRILKVLEEESVNSQSSPKWFDCLASGLQKISMELIGAEARLKTPNFRVFEGRLMDSGEVGFFGRRLFTEIACLNAQHLDIQLGDLINSVFSTASANISIAYVLIDVLLELTVRISSLLLNNSHVFTKLIDGVCALPDEVATVLIRSIMPIINQRAKLREHLLKTMKVHLLNSAKISSALPIILLLLKSLSEQPSVRETTKMSQSFATFSTQVLAKNNLKKHAESSVALEVLGCVKRCINQSAYTKCLVYKGLVDICKRNSLFVVQVIDLLISQLEALPTISVKNFIIPANKQQGVMIKLPYAHLVKALSNLIRISINCGQDREQLTNVASAATTLTARAKFLLDDLCEKLLSQDILEIDGVSHLKAQRSPSNLALSQMMLDVYDVFVEHLWGIDDSVFGVHADTAKKIVNLMEKRKIVFGLLSEKSAMEPANENTQQTTKTNKGKGAKRGAKNAPKTRTSTVSTSSSRIAADLKDPSSLGIIKLDINVQDLERIFSTLISRDFVEIDLVFKRLRDILLGWSIEKLYVHSKSLNPFSIGGTIPMTCYTSLAKSLIQFYLGEKISDELFFMRWDALKTMALMGYSKIMEYLIVRYQERSTDSLNEIYECLNADNLTTQIGTTQTPHQAGLNPTQRGPLNSTITATQAKNAEADRKSFYRVLVKHLNVYSIQILPALFELQKSFADKKLVVDFQRQGQALISLCSRIVGSIPITRAESRKNVFRILNKVVQKCSINDKTLVKEFWHLVLTTLEHSELSESFVNTFKVLVTDLKNVEQGNSVSDDEGYRSITFQNRETIMHLTIESMNRVLSNVSLSFVIKAEMGTPNDDETLLNTVFLTQQISAIIEIVLDSWAVDSELLMSPLTVLLTTLYQAIYDIVRQFVNEYSAKRPEIADWQSIRELENFVHGALKNLVGMAANSISKYGTDNQTATQNTQDTTKLLKNAKKDERLFVQYERCFEKLQIELIQLTKLSKDDFELKIATMVNIRDFKINHELLLEKVQRRGYRQCESVNTDEPSTMAILNDSMDDDNDEMFDETTELTENGQIEDDGLLLEEDEMTNVTLETADSSLLDEGDESLLDDAQAMQMNRIMPGMMSQHPKKSTTQNGRDSLGGSLQRIAEEENEEDEVQRVIEAEERQNRGPLSRMDEEEVEEEEMENNQEFELEPYEMGFPEEDELEEEETPQRQILAEITPTTPVSSLKKGAHIRPFSSTGSTSIDESSASTTTTKRSLGLRLNNSGPPKNNKETTTKEPNLAKRPRLRK